ncbi:MAG: outer membrane beta-barrel protein [Bacteroidia bacterium]
MIRQISFILAFLLLPILAFSQNKLSFGVQAQPKLSFYSTEYTKGTGFLRVAFSSNGESLGVSFGGFVQYEIGSNFFVRSGLSHESTKFENTIWGPIFPDDLINETTSTLRYTATFSFISIPLDFAYRLTPRNGKVQVHVGLGVSSNLTNSVTQRLSITSEGRIDEQLHEEGYMPNPSTFSFGFLGGIEFSLGEKFGLGIEPRIKFTPNEFVWLFAFESKTTAEASVAVMLRVK